MVTLKRKEQVYTVEAGVTLEQALRELGILPETVLAVREGKIVPLSHRLADGEELELVDVISGG
jgi:sulfur carrier protein ThiS